MSKKSRHRLSLPAVFGIIGGILMVFCLIALSTNQIFAFFNLEGFIVVIGGVLMITSISYSREDMRSALQAIAEMFHTKTDHLPSLKKTLHEIVGWANIVKLQGPRGLELALKRQGIADPFTRYGLNMVISNYNGTEIRAMMTHAADTAEEKDMVPASVLHSMANHAPAFGMIGTLVGMVIMLSNLRDSTTEIGPSLGVAFLATLYGVLSARLIYLPAATRVLHQVETKRAQRMLLTEGLALISDNKSPSHIQDRLQAFLQSDAIGESLPPPVAILRPQTAQTVRA